MKAYLEYPGKLLFTNLKELISLSLDEVKEIEKNIENVKMQNQEILKQNQAEVEEFIEKQVANFAAMGIDVHKYKKTKYKTEKNGYVRWFATNVVNPLTEKWCKMYQPPHAKVENEIDGIKISIIGTMTDLESVYKKAKQQYNDAIKSNAEYLKSIEYAEKHDIEIPKDLSPKSTWDYVNEIASENYFENELPEGTEIQIDCCDECDSFTVGNHRCECGNIRVSIEIEGNHVDGFYYYATPC